MATRGGVWFTSSFSNGNQTCVEVRFRDGSVDVRDTKDRQGPVLTLSADDWVTFLSDASGPLSTEPVGGGGTDLRLQGHPSPLRFTDAEWSAFRRGVDAGEFTPLLMPPERTVG